MSTVNNKKKKKKEEECMKRRKFKGRKPEMLFQLTKKKLLREETYCISVISNVYGLPQNSEKD